MTNSPIQQSEQHDINLKKLEIDLIVTAETALSVGGSGNTGLRADKTILRDGHNRPIIPASQIKGRLRHASEALLRSMGIPICRGPYPNQTCPHLENIPNPPCPICLLFGSAWYTGTLRFADLRLVPMLGEDSAIRAGIGVDRKRRVVRDELLFMTETTAPGVSPKFKADSIAISGMVSDAGIGVMLLVTLKLIHSLGGSKSRGMGWTTIDVKAMFGGEPIDLTRNEEKEAMKTWLQQFTS